MIKINLLPQNTTKGGIPRGGLAGPSLGQGPLILVLTIVVMVALNAAAGWGAFRSVVAARERMEEVKSRHETVSKQIKQMMSQAEQVRKFREVVTNQMDVLASLDPPARILWCEKINMLSNLIPPNVFLSEVMVTEQVEMVETEASKAARLKWDKMPKKVGKEPQPVKRPLISYRMKLTGLGLGKDNVEQFNNVMRFHQAMTTYSIQDGQGKERKFMDGFNTNIDLGSIEATVYEGAPVNQFTFTLTTKTIGSDESKTSTTADNGITSAPATGLRSRRDRINKDLEQ